MREGRKNMSKEFTEEDYIQSFKYQYRLNSDENLIPDGFRSLLDLAYLNGRLLFRRYVPFEQKDFEQLPETIKKTQGIEQLKLLEEMALLKPIAVVTLNGRSHR